MPGDTLQQQRFELKYVVSESTALIAREFVRAYLKVDENGACLDQFSYPVHSIYLDSDDLSLYQQTIKGDKNRYKIRLRFYNDNPNSPIFLEIKRRSDSAILKERCAVTREGAREVLSGLMPSDANIISRDPKHRNALANFQRLVLFKGAKAKGHVAYLREAWIYPHDNSVRVTMDRNVRFEARPAGELSTRMTAPIPVFGNNVILELKFTGRFPMWFNELVRSLQLMQRSAAKYADGVSGFGSDRLQMVCEQGFLPPVENREVA